MFESAERSIADARQASISPETRLDVAYRAITPGSEKLARILRGTVLHRCDLRCKLSNGRPGNF